MNDVLVVKDLVNKASFVKPFPLKSQLIEEDYPVWDGGGIPAEIESELLEMEESGEITDYFDYVEINEGHKIGGYPNFIQSGIDFGEGYEFLIQIASDEKQIWKLWIVEICISLKTAKQETGNSIAILLINNRYWRI